MKVRDSGMPEESLWDSFFNVENILSEMEINSRVDDLAEIGCGYGTITITASQIIKGKVYAFDIDAEMLRVLKQKISSMAESRIVPILRDVLVNGTGCPDASLDYVMLFNILHHHSPEEFFDEAYRILRPGAKAGIIHWRSDKETPRGPEASIRPTPEFLLSKVDPEKFNIVKQPFILEPYHFGIILAGK